MVNIQKRVRRVIYNNWGKASVKETVGRQLKRKHRSIRFKYD